MHTYDRMSKYVYAVYRQVWPTFFDALVWNSQFIKINENNFIMTLADPVLHCFS